METRVAVKVVILLSGGMDSAVVLAQAVAKGRQIHALTLDYGQRHRRELLAAKRLAKRAKVKEHVVLRLPLRAIAAGALVDGGKVRKSGARPGKPTTYVTFRNGVFLALAASFAEARGAREIWGGWCATDLGGYPDCRPVFLRAMAKAIATGTWGRGAARIVAPLGRLDKAAVTRLGQRLGVRFGETWTCYDPQKGRACRHCDACRLRQNGFEVAHVRDPLFGIKKSPTDLKRER